MSHQLTLELPDELFIPLEQKAQATGQSVEAVAQACLTDALRVVAPGSQLRKWVGALASGVSDAGIRHDEYIGKALFDELNEPKDD